MLRPALCALVFTSVSAVPGCKTTDEQGADTKDVVTQNGQMTTHYYAVGEEARRALCPFGLDSEDPETYRAQCDVTKKMPVADFTENLERAYSERFKSGDALTDEENLIGGLMVQSLSEPSILKVKAGDAPTDNSDVITARFAQVFEKTFGIQGGSENEGGGPADNGGTPGNGGDSGSQILTVSFVAALGLSSTPLIVSQNPVSTNAVTVQLNGCQGQILGMAIAEGAGQPVLAMGSPGPGKFATISGKARKMAMIQLTVNSSGGFCQVKVVSAGTGGNGGNNGAGNNGGGDPGQLGPETQIGVIQYNGGFIPQLVAPLNPARLVKQFRVGVPSGCQADVVKGGILTTQQVAPTTVLNSAQHVYLVNNGAGTSASGISVSLNGPLGFCQIPIFVR